MLRLVPRSAAVVALILAASPPLAAQKDPTAKQPSIIGTWRVDANKKVKDGPREVVIRTDSSASWGKETVRWRLKGKDQIGIVLGGEWEVYRIKVNPESLTLSGGDLTEAITLRKVGPATDRPASAKIPDDPDSAGS